MSQLLHDQEGIDGVAATHEIVFGILAEIGGLPRLMELVYFANEPGLLEAARWLASISDDGRRQLEEFVTAAGAASVQIERPEPNRLTMKLVQR
jgi:hypothetical protein